MMLCLGLFLLDFALAYWKNKSIRSFINKSNILIYLIASLPAISYLTWRLITRGYISSHPLETYGNTWGYESFADFFINLSRNAIVMIQRITDFGRIVPLIFIALAFYYKKYTLKLDNIKTLILCTIIPTIVVSSISIIIKNPMGHRYFISSYLCFSILAFILIQEFKYKKTIYTCLLASLLCGNLIVYPDNFAQGWDASLAHLPYWNLRREAIDFIDEEEIKLTDVATFFPNYHSLDAIDLNGDLRSFSSFSGNNKFVFYSNVYNLTDKELERLSTNYTVIKTFKRRTVKIDILERSYE